MRQNAFLDQSLKLADLFQKNCIGDLKRPDRGVKQAGFLVLYKTTMPSVLVELGFLSNLEEEKFLKSDEGRSSLAKELFDAFETYKKLNDIVDGTLDEDGSTINKDDKEGPVKATNKTNTSKENNANGVVFKVQIATSTTELETASYNFKGMKDVEKVKSGKYFKYIVGNYQTVGEAKKRQDEVREKGYKTAFVIAYENGKRVDLQKAISKSKM